MAYMLGTAALGVQNPLGIVDLKTGVFTLIGNMGSGGYDGLAVANGVLYTEQNGLLYSVNTSNANLTLIGGLNGNNLATFGSTTTGLYGLAGTGSNCGGYSIFDKSPDGRHHGDRADRRQRRTQRSRFLCEAFRRVQHAVHGIPTAIFTPSTRPPARPRRWEPPTRNDYLTSVPLFENGTYYAGYWFR